MNIKSLRNAMIDEGNDIYFVCDEKTSGVASTVVNSVFTFQVWYGSKTRMFDSFEQMVSTKFFGGKSIIDLLDTVDIRFC